MFSEPAVYQDDDDDEDDWDDENSDDVGHDEDDEEESDDDDDDGEFEDEEDEDEDEEFDEEHPDDLDDEEYVEDYGFDEDENEGDEDGETRISTFCVVLMCACLCVLLGAAGALLGVYVFDDYFNNKGRDEDLTTPITTARPSTIPPTNIPSKTPTISTRPTNSHLPSISPSSQPTISFGPTNFVPEFFEFQAYQDTTITNSDATDVSSYGSNEEVLVVFKGPINTNEIGLTSTESFSLIAFNITSELLPRFDNPIYINRETSALLKLQHIPRPGSAGPINMTLSLLSQNNILDANSIEDMTYDTWMILFDDATIDDNIVVLGRTYFEVLPDQIYVDIDVTDILLNSVIQRERRRRKLEPVQYNNNNDDDDSFVIFQITRTNAASEIVIDNDVDLATTTELPNRFHSRESSTTTAPILEIQLIIPSENPTISIEPSSTTTAEPTTSPTTTTNNSTMSNNVTTSQPTLVPTTTLAPSNQSLTEDNQ